MTYITSWERDGAAKERKAIVERLLRRRFGEDFDASFISRIQTLELSKLYDLAEDLLDFRTIEDLVDWLDSKND